MYDNRAKGKPEGNESQPGSLLSEISDVSAQLYLLSHTDAEATVTDTRRLMRENTKLGRMALSTAGKLADRGVNSRDAYLLGIVHGIALSERRRDEQAFDAEIKTLGIHPDTAEDDLGTNP